MIPACLLNTGIIFHILLFTDTYCDVHAGGVAVDVASQRTRKQQSLMQQWKRTAFSLWSVPVMTSCNNGGILDGVFLWGPSAGYIRRGDNYILFLQTAEEYRLWNLTYKPNYNNLIMCHTTLHLLHYALLPDTCYVTPYYITSCTRVWTEWHCAFHELSAVTIMMRRCCRISTPL
jgi:hypothetical protein